MNTCRCDAAWPGANMAHCSVCHRTFASISGFDDHGPSRKGCGNPVILGYTEVNGIWATPEGHAQRARSAAKMASARAARGEDPVPSPLGLAHSAPTTHPRVNTPESVSSASHVRNWPEAAV